ncbi:MAG: hypothetical protein CMJ58_12610 [Planctomycetaceae bacterium]|nr:hypothetical protein [Planctomycetaceae bacterium]
MAKGLDVSKTAGLLGRQLEDVARFAAKRTGSTSVSEPSMTVVDGGQTDPTSEPAPAVQRTAPPRKKEGSRPSRKTASQPPPQDRSWVAPTWKIDRDKARLIDRIFLLMRADGVGPRYKQDLVDEAMDWLIEKHKEYVRR